MTLRVSEEQPADIAAIASLNRAAFGGPGEAELVDRLREVGALPISLVAREGDEILGHIAFSPVVADGKAGRGLGLGLAPMAVRPDRQREGIGTKLVERGLEIAAASGAPFVVVLGHPDYYPRFGFELASTFDIAWEQAGYASAFFVRALDAGDLPRGGTIRYRPEFDAV